jgi:hypothetical protein|tara:strand:- start:184 stop:663 length:480 start_codon:yes stop_codon:yes gene_type:complete
VHKKSQAALEFLTTYGWAFLVILIMISALAYFGILNPSKILPDRCNFGAEFECRDFQISRTSDSIKIRLKNNAGGAITITSMTVSTESAIALVCDDPDILGVWANGAIDDFTFSQCNSDEVGFIPGEKSKVLIKIGYYAVRSGEGYGHDVNGEIFATVI